MDPATIICQGVRLLSTYEEGADGLMKERRGKASAAKCRTPKMDPQVTEDLIAENQRLRMEIEYLKKLSALVLAEEQKSGKRRS